MAPPRIAIRCDGGAAQGAGHVARCRPVALAFAGLGWLPTFVGRYDGLAAWLVDGTGFEVLDPGSFDPTSFQAAFVDVYDADVCELARALPIATPGEAARCEEAGILVDYHLDRDKTEDGPRLLAGPRYAPVDPAFARARRRRGEVRRVLVTLGASERVRALAPELTLRVAAAFPGAELLVPGDLPAAPGTAVRRPNGRATLVEAALECDLAVTGAGMTAYEMACAGIPFLAVAVADNQMRVARGVEEREIGLAVDVRGGISRAGLDARLGELADPRIRERLASAGPLVVDGQGAARTAAGLRERWAVDR